MTGSNEALPQRRLLRSVRDLSRAAGRLRFAPPVAYVLNPLDYARPAVERYLEWHARVGVEALLLGMNPGPFGMVQTGVPFGEIAAVRDWLRIRAAIGRPERQHPRRPVLGFDCPRSEVSGRRFWGWAERRFGTPERFFRTFFVWNYCPLAFLEESGRNRTPDRLPASERDELFGLCDAALVRVVEALRPRRVVGIGAFAERRARAALERTGAAALVAGRILHPSPANPAANRGWESLAEAQLRSLGIALPPSAGESGARRLARRSKSE